MHYRHQRFLGMVITPEKDLGCEQRCAARLPVIGAAGEVRVRASLKEFSLSRSVLHSSGREQS